MMILESLETNSIKSRIEKHKSNHDPMENERVFTFLRVCYPWAFIAWLPMTYGLKIDPNGVLGV